MIVVLLIALPLSCCCVTIPLPSADLTSLNEKCRTSNCAFIYSQVAGVFSQVFCDFGAEFIVSDKVRLGRMWGAERANGTREGVAEEANKSRAALHSLHSLRRSHPSSPPYPPASLYCL